LGTLAAVASRYDKNGIDILFLNSKKKGTGLKVKRLSMWLCHSRIDRFIHVASFVSPGLR